MQSLAYRTEQVRFAGRLAGRCRLVLELAEGEVPRPRDEGGCGGAVATPAGAMAHGAPLSVDARTRGRSGRNVGSGRPGQIGVDLGIGLPDREGAGVAHA